MSNWKNLPVEILDKIFEQTYRKEKIKCSMTCRSWKSAAQRALFKQLPPLRDQQMYNLIEALSRNSSDVSPGNFVRVIKCTWLSKNFDLAILDKTFPYIEDIRIDNKQYDIIRQLILQGTFPNLKKIPYRKWDKDHLELVLERKKDIKELEVDTLYFEIVDRLYMFPKLDSFELSVFHQNGTTLYLEQFLPKDLPQLKSIRFSIQANYKLDWSTMPLSTSDIQPFPSIRNVDIYSNELLLNGEKSYSYLMKKFPNLEVLKLHCNTYTVFRKSDYKVPSIACLHQFLVYLYNIRKESTAIAIITDQHTPELVVGFFNYVLSRTSKCYDKVETHLKIIFYVVEEDEEEDHCQDRIANISVHNSFKSNTKLCKVEVEYRVNEGSTSLPYTELFQKIGNMRIESLTIGDEDAENREEGVPLVLDTVIDHFNILKTFRICRYSDITCSTKQEIEESVPSTLENLIFNDCELKESIFPQISARCLNLKKIEFIKCSFLEKGIFSDQLQDEERIISFVMPSTSLDELYFLSALKSYYYEAEHDKIFIKLKTAQGKPRYCKLYYYQEETHYVVPEDGNADYSICLLDKKCVIYDIYCKAVRYLVVDTDDYGKAIQEEEYIY